MKIHKFDDYNYYSDMLDFFIENLQVFLTESDSNKKSYKEIEKKVISDFNLNISLIGTFGTGIAAFYPIVDQLIKNMNINIDMTAEKVVLLTITAISIIYLEEKKSNMKNEEFVRKSCKSMLEELKMSGIGNGIVKKLISGLKSIKNIFSLIGKHLGTIVSGFMDMFAYSALLVPVMNAILSIVGKYDLTLDTLPGNFLSLSIGVGTLIAKHSIIDILSRIRGKFPINKKKVIDEIEVPIIQKVGDMTHIDSDIKSNKELINEDR